MSLFFENDTDDMDEASKILNIQQSNIWKVLNGERNRAGGYYFEYDKGCDK